MNLRKKILLFTDWYEPGFKAGGPIQSCKNLVAKLNGDYDFYVFTSDRDINEQDPYDGIVANQWTNRNEYTKVWYASPSSMSAVQLRNIVRTIQPEIIYFNSMFSKGFTLLPLWILKKEKFKGRVVLAPRGMLHSGAISQKKLKKRLFLNLFRLTGWQKKIIFHATDDQERKDILHFFPGAHVQVAPNIPNIANGDGHIPEKISDQLKAVFISRVHPKKNLHYLLQLFNKVDKHQQLQLDVFGVTDDEVYAERCRQMAAALPSNVKVNFFPAVPNQQVFDTLRQYHVFMLATLGENFGHAIFESLAAGRPVLISDQTPWRNLEEQKAGWDIPLNNEAAFQKSLWQLLQMKQDEYDRWVQGARTLADNFIAQQDYRTIYLRLFNEAGN